MKLEIKPRLGVSNLQFNDSRENIRNKVNSKFSSFKRNQFAESECDYFELLGIFVYYDSDDNCEAFEFTAEVELILWGINLLETTFEQLKMTLLSKDENCELEDESLTSLKFGIACSKSLESDRCESILIFVDGYYD